MKKLWIDTETEGLGSKDKVVEIGWALTYYEDGKFCILSCGSFLLPGKPWEGTGIPEKCTRMLSESHVANMSASFLDAAAQADIYVAHNISFDLRMLKKTINIPNKPEMCTCNDVSWDILGCKSKKLQDIAEKYGIKSISAHTALSDIFTMIEIIKSLEERFFVDLCKNRIDTFNRFSISAAPTNGAKESDAKPDCVKVENKENYRMWFKEVPSDKIEELGIQKQGDKFFIDFIDYTKKDLVDFMSSNTFCRPPNSALKRLS